MKYFLDTEFQEIDYTQPVQLISIALLCEDGRSYYAELDGIDYASLDPWLQENVVPHLLGAVEVGVTKPRETIADEIVEFFAPDEGHIEIWAYYGAYDWLHFCQLFGRMVGIPKGLPRHYMDLRMLADLAGVRKRNFPKRGPTAHNALADCLWNKELYELLTTAYNANRQGE